MKPYALAVLVFVGCAAPEARDPSTSAPVEVAIAPMASAPPVASTTPDAAASVAVVDAAPPPEDAAVAATEDATGSMFGDPIGDSFGAGGLGLPGTSEGGGGRGAGIGLGNVGSLGHGAGTGRNGGDGGAPPSAPKLREGAVTVTGALPPEVVRRIVRQNFGRFRLCYENGLRKNPNLAGNLLVSFTIDAAGAVSRASDGGSTLADPAVVTCVVRAFGALSFPQPVSGSVTVGYPITLLPR